MLQILVYFLYAGAIIYAIRRFITNKRPIPFLKKLQLFSDHTFKLLNHGPFGGTFYRGSYTLQADTLKLGNEDLKDLYPALKLVLKEQHAKKFFDPVDSLKKDYALFVNEDRRP